MDAGEPIKDVAVLGNREAITNDPFFMCKALIM